MINEKFDPEIEEAVEKLALQLEPKTRDQFSQAERFMLKKSMQSCGMKSLPDPIGDGERCSGECVCEKCGHDFYHHPEEWRRIGYGNVPYLKILCDGTLVKL